MRILIGLVVLFPFLVSAANQDQDIDKARSQIDEIRRLIQQPKEEKELQWNRYVTANFEILSLDDAQGKYLSENIEFIKTWILWRWGMKDVNFSVKCKLICVPDSVLYEKLFNRKTPFCKVEAQTVWYITTESKWNTKLPLFLTEIVLFNYESQVGTKLPVWCHRGMSVLNGRYQDIRSSTSLVRTCNTKRLLEMTKDGYNKLNDTEKSVFDGEAAGFCLWARQEFNGKVFLDFLGGSLINPQESLRYFSLNSYESVNVRVQSYLSKLPSGADYYLTW